MSLKSFIGLVLFTSCVCPNPLHANGNENGEPIVNKVKLQFTSTAAAPEPLFLLTADGEVIPIELPRQHLSPIIELESMKSWSVGLHDVETGEFDAVAVASALDSAHQILIFTTDPLEGGFALTAIEGSPERFKADTYQLLNASGKKITGKLNNRQFVMQPGGHELIQPDGQGEVLNAAFAINDKHGDAVPFVNNAWRRNPLAKSMVIIYLDQKTQRPRSHTIRIFP